MGYFLDRIMQSVLDWKSQKHGEKGHFQTHTFLRKQPEDTHRSPGGGRGRATGESDRGGQRGERRAGAPLNTGLREYGTQVPRPRQPSSPSWFPETWHRQQTGNLTGPRERPQAHTSYRAQPRAPRAARSPEGQLRPAGSEPRVGAL